MRFLPTALLTLAIATGAHSAEAPALEPLNKRASPADAGTTIAAVASDGTGSALGSSATMSSMSSGTASASSARMSSMASSMASSATAGASAMSASASKAGAVPTGVPGQWVFVAGVAVGAVGLVG